MATTHHGTQAAGNRIADSTPTRTNRHIAAEADARIEYFAGHLEEIPPRLADLEREWDIERALITNASTLALVGLVLGILVKRRWLALSMVVMSFLLQHGIQGWCPPLPLFRRMGLRTKEEILRERYALRALNGELEPLCEPDSQVPAQRAANVLAAINE
jgi:hypothetical protein